MLELSRVFDAGYYSASYPDLMAAGLTTSDQLFNHFISAGITEGRGFSPYINLNYYEAVNPDLGAAGLTTGQQLLDHLFGFGLNEKRPFSPNVNLNYYAAANADLGAAGLTSGEQLFDHLINFAAREGRQIAPPSPELPNVAPPNPVLPPDDSVPPPTLPPGVPAPPPPPAPPGFPELPPPGPFSGISTTQQRSLSANSVESLVAEGLEVAKAHLNNFGTAPDFSAKINTAFGETVNLDAAKTLIQNMAKGNALPVIEVLSAEEIGGAQGAFDAITNTAYLSKEFLAGNSGNSEAIANVLLEEIGHSIDSRLNAADAPGDEGAIFAALVQGRELSQSELMGLKNEIDQTDIFISGNYLSVEFSSSWTAYIGDWNGKWLNQFSLSGRSDGLNGINVDWGSGSVGGLSDYFILATYTTGYFDANKNYQFRVKADDGFLIYTSPDGKNWDRLMQNWEFAYRDHKQYNTFKQYNFTPSKTGHHYVYVLHFEREGNAYLDLAWDNGLAKSKSNNGASYWRGDQALQIMYEEMKNNSQSWQVNTMKAQNFLSPIKASPDALLLWTGMVIDKIGPWDHKPDLTKDLQLVGTDFYFPIWGDSQHEYYYDIWSNIHYGYVGKAAGFSDSILQEGSLLNDVLKGNWDMNDVKAISLGIQLWNETNGNPNNLTPEKLRQKIISNGSSLSRYSV